MSPERLAEIRDILRAPGLHWEREITDAGRELLAHLDTLTAERNTLLDRVDRLTAALAREQKERRAEVDTLTAERDELAATLANERGEGESPDGWEPDPSRGGAWGWARVAGGRVLDADFVTGTSYEGPPFRGWDWRVVDVAGTGRVVARGRCDTARAAMRAADAAYLTTNTSPDAATE